MPLHVDQPRHLDPYYMQKFNTLMTFFQGPKGTKGVSHRWTLFGCFYQNGNRIMTKDILEKNAKFVQLKGTGGGGGGGGTVLCLKNRTFFLQIVLNFC